MLIESEATLEERLSQPWPVTIKTLGEYDGDILILGIGGKMGPSLARLIQRADAELGQRRRLIGVSRFSNSTLRHQLEIEGIQTIAANALDTAQVQALPDSEIVIHMTGMKFGTGTNPGLTWATNTLGPSKICERYPQSRILAFSTGNVYPLVPSHSKGCPEDTPLEASGEYANAAIGRERIFDYYSRENRTAISLLRLNYAVEPRYGVLHDIGKMVWNNEVINLAMGLVNVIWQGDANNLALCALSDASSPAQPINIAGAEIISVKSIADQFAHHFGKPPRFLGEEAPTALLNDGRAAHRRYAAPRVAVADVIHWTADWIASGKRSFNKPTHFQTRDGKF